MSRRITSVALAAMMLLGGVASAQTKKSAAKSESADSPGEPRKAYTFSSKYYKITTDVDKELSKEIAAHMDAVFKEYNRRFADYGPPLKQQLPLYVYTTQEGYMKMLASKGVDGTGSGGMFFGGSSLAAFIGNQGLERMFHTLRHEGFHQFAHFRIGHELPTWCNEGLAEYFGEAIMIKGALHTGQVPVEKLAYVQGAVKANGHIPFNTLINMSHSEWNSHLKDGSAQLQYEQSWAMVQHLVEGDKRYKDAFASYLFGISKGQDSASAFAKAFGSTDYKPFEEAWKKYILALQPNPEKTAAKRLQFLASGMEWLKAKGESAASLDELKEKLQSRKFGMRYSVGHGQVMTMTSTDEENFKAPESATKKPTTLDWEPPAGDKLPGLVVKGLKYTVRLTWTKDPLGTDLIPRVAYE